jgi:hypothetical protein
MVRHMALAVFLCMTVSAWADYRVFIDDREGFETALKINPLSTIIDSGDMFAPDPAESTDLDLVHRSGLIGGQTYAYDLYDMDFASGSAGWVIPGAIGGDIFDLDYLDVECPVTQEGATGIGTWGADGGTGSNSTRNAALIDFTETPGGLGVGHFAADLQDFESSAEWVVGELRVYDNGMLAFSAPIVWADDGNGVIHFLGVAADHETFFFDQVMLVVGDDGPGSGFYERWAADRITFGQARSCSLCDGDLNGNGFVNVADFTIFAAAYGSQIGSPAYHACCDLHEDGTVNVSIGPRAAPHALQSEAGSPGGPALCPSSRIS